MMDSIPFNRPYLTGNEEKYIAEAMSSRKLAGNGQFTQLCQKFFEDRYGIKKALLTTSCTDALEMCALLLDIGPGDEVIVPSYTFVSSALAFTRQGATIRFVDSRKDHPGMDEDLVEKLIKPNTKAIVCVHYAGVACDMDKLMALAEKYKIFVVEDAAQAIESFYKGKPLGSIGHLATFSFHETKNIICGEGGLLAINDERFAERAEIIWEKGTNRSKFFRGEIDKYGWVDTGSSFLPSELCAAFLWAQLELLGKIQSHRIRHWEYYQQNLKDSEVVSLRIPEFPDYATNNAHMYYLVLEDLEQRTECINYLSSRNVKAVFHYQALHCSDYYSDLHDGRSLPLALHYTNCLVRLPMFGEMTKEDLLTVISSVSGFCRTQ